MLCEEVMGTMARVRALTGVDVTEGAEMMAAMKQKNIPRLTRLLAAVLEPSTTEQLHQLLRHTCDHLPRDQLYLPVAAALFLDYTEQQKRGTTAAAAAATAVSGASSLTRALDHADSIAQAHRAPLPPAAPASPASPASPAAPAAGDAPAPAPACSLSVGPMARKPRSRAAAWWAVPLHLLQRMAILMFMAYVMACTVVGVVCTYDMVLAPTPERAAVWVALYARLLALLELVLAR